MIGIRTNASLPDVPRHYRADDGSKLTVYPDGTAMFRDAAGLWSRVPLMTLADLAATADTDSAAAQKARMLAVAGEAAARTLAALR